MQDSIQPQAPSPLCLSADLIGAACGSTALLLHGVLTRLPLSQVYALTVMSGLLSLAVLASLLTVLTKPSHLISRSKATGIAVQLGCRSGIRAVLVGGAGLVFLVACHAFAAPTAAAEFNLKARLWLTWAVVVAALLPGVFGGLVGGILGAKVIAGRLPTTVEKPATSVAAASWLRPLSLGTLLLASAGLASPLLFLLRSPKVDPPAITASPHAPSPFLYETPPGIQSAKIGELQPAITKIIEGIRQEAPVSLSVDGRWLAYGDTTAGGPAIGVYDLNHFQKIASIQVPDYPQESLAWSPDFKSLACSLGNGGDRRIWILRVAGAKSIALPRPPGRDTPGGELFWWQEHELVFFPTDEPPLVFDLAKLVLKPLGDSSFFTQLDAAAKHRWLEGPRTSLPSQKGWKLEVRTVIRSVVPPPRRKPDTDWAMFGDSILAMSHPDLPVSYGFDSLVVSEGSKVLCAADGSKVIRLGNGRAEVTYMKQAAAPPLHFEVSMPLADDAIQKPEWKQHVVDGEICVLVCAPLINPLNHQVVGPDFQQVRGIAQLVEWQGRRAVFVMQTYGRPIQSTDIATTLHAWADGRQTIWKQPVVKDWWTAIQPVARELPKTLADLYMPTLLTLKADASPFAVVKAAERHRPAAMSSASPAALIPSPLSENSIAALDADFSSAASPQGTPSVPGLSPAAPITSAPVTVDGVKEFIVAHHTKAAQGDVAGMAADYDQTVDFLDKGRLSRDAILAEETAQRQKWPRSSERILGPVVVSHEGGLWTASYTLEFYDENAAGEWHRGQVDLTMTMTSQIGVLIIISQKGRVHDVQSGSRK